MSRKINDKMEYFTLQLEIVMQNQMGLKLQYLKLRTQ